MPAPTPFAQYLSNLGADNLGQGQFNGGLTSKWADQSGNGRDLTSRIGSIAFTGSPTGGTFTLIVTVLNNQGGTATAITGAISYNATAATLGANIQTSLRALSNIGGTKATVDATNAPTFLATWDSTLGAVTFTLGTNSLTGTTPSVLCVPFCPTACGAPAGICFPSTLAAGGNVTIAQRQAFMQASFGTSLTVTSSTYIFVLKPASVNQNNGSFAGIFSTTPNYSVNLGITDASGNFAMSLFGFGGPTPAIVLPSTPSVVALVCSGSSGTIYLNNRNVSQTLPLNGTSAETGCTIGSLHTPGNPFVTNAAYNGMIQDLEIYNSVLSNADLDARMAALAAREGVVVNPTINVVVLGDSTSCCGDDNTTSTAWPDCAPYLAKNAVIYNWAIPGQHLATFDHATGPGHPFGCFNAAIKTNLCLILGGRNDIGTGSLDAPTTFADLKIIGNAARAVGFRVGVGTVPYVSSVNGEASSNGAMATYNNSILAGDGSYNFSADLANDRNMLNPADVLYFENPDAGGVYGLHPSTAGRARMGAIWDSAIRAYLTHGTLIIKP